VRRIALVDHSKRHKPEPGVLDAIAEALTVQIERDVAPAWGIAPREVRVGGSGDKVHVFDSAEQADEFGWHIVDAHGLPYSHVYVEGSLAVGSDWLTGDDSVSSTLSHEALEMLVDPGANQYAFDWGRLLWACEICDPVQADVYSIRAGGLRVPVSDFVLPSFFSLGTKGPWDHLGVLKAPFSLAEGGYAVRQGKGKRTERAARRFDVVFDKAMPEATRQQKLDGWGRTFWRRAVHP
jgi:hypothetical protein